MKNYILIIRTSHDAIQVNIKYFPEDIKDVHDAIQVDVKHFPKDIMDIHDAIQVDVKHFFPKDIMDAIKTGNTS